jgi:hypothetical protein
VEPGKRTSTREEKARKKEGEEDAGGIDWIT